MSTVVTNIRIDKELKAQATELFLVFHDYIKMSFNTPEAVWYAPAPAPWITSGDG